MAGLPPLSERGVVLAPRRRSSSSPPQRDLKDVQTAIGRPYYLGNGLDLLYRDRRQPEAFETEDIGFRLAVMRETPLGRFVLGAHYLDSKKSLAQTSKPDAVSFEMIEVPIPDKPGETEMEWQGVVMYDFRSLRMKAEPKRRFEGAQAFIDKIPEVAPEILDDLKKILPGRVKPPVRIGMRPIHEVSFFIVLPRIVEGPISLPFDIPFKNFAYLHYQAAA